MGSKAGQNFDTQHSTEKFLKERRHPCKEFRGLIISEDGDKLLEVGCRYDSNGSSTSESSIVMKIHIHQFDGKDFNLWRIKMRALLIQQGLLKALEGKSKLPTTMSEEDKEDYLNHALSSIQMCLSDNVLQEVMDETTPDGLWRKLEKIYVNKSFINERLLKLKLYGLRMKEGTSLEDHLNEFNKLVSDLRNIDVEIEDEDQAVLLLCSLAPSYEQFVDTMLQGRTSISLEDVKACLQLNELMDERVERADTNVGNRHGLVAQGKKVGKSGNWDETKSKSYSKRTVTCFECGEEGHFRRNCPNS